MPVTLIASDCPLPIAPGAFPWPADCYAGADEPDVAPGLTSGDVAMTPKWNQVASMLDLAARTGSGAYALAFGTGVISAGTGLLIETTGAIAAIDGVVAVKAFAPKAVPDDTARVWLWLRQNGTLDHTVTTTPPTSKCVLLGSCVTASGLVTSVDTSGVVYCAGGQVWRETADIGPPTDSPPSSSRIITRTETGVYLWDGVRHGELVSGMRAAVTMPSDANYTLTMAQAKASIIEVSGSPSTGRNIVLPLADGMMRTVGNKTAQTLTFIGATGTGVAVATTKVAQIYCDGTNWLRAGPDV